MNGDGPKYLDILFNSLLKQTYTNFEIIISDHSKNNDIKDLCLLWKTKLNISYYHNPNNVGEFSPNLNNCLKLSHGDIIKILFQDDFLLDENSLEIQLVHLLGNDNYWSATACAHTNDGINIFRPHYPKYHDNIHYGENTIGSPSVLMFKNKDIIEFDENIFWLVDTDYYKRLYEKFGFPSICNYITVIIREHSNQVSNTLATEKIKQKELNYIIKKYK
jgi:glycosyltransferase involved in cell wall biosynthesis